MNEMTTFFTNDPLSIKIHKSKE
ncbi:hypothetical protein C0971_16545 [Bacillus methanolicus]|nr:hypothetical protein C0971_16545 [Bacillus methanolicus]